MNSSSYLNLPQLIVGIFGVVVGLTPVVGIIFLVAWFNDIRKDIRKIREVLSKRFPEEYDEE